MNIMIPDKLKKGDEVRVISPSRSLAIISQENREIANTRFKELGLNLSFSKHVEEEDDFGSSSVKSRIEDLHEAFLDRNVRAVIAVIGGFNSNQLLKSIDWQLLRANPKIFCGYSDITALNDAILAKTGLVTYSGPAYSTFGMKKHFEYTLEYFKKCLMTDLPIDIQPTDEWTDDLWYLDQNNRTVIKNEGWLVIQEGQAEGQIIGGNLCTFNLLQGTEFMPDISNLVMFIEDDLESQPHHFDRNLVSLIQQPAFKTVKALLIGRFQKGSNMTNDLLIKIINSKKELSKLPIIANLDFGHTSPIITIPIGGKVEVVASNSKPKITITKH